MEELQVLIEFTGVSRMLTGVSELSLNIKPGTAFAEIVSLLGQKYPSLLGQIIDKNGRDFIATNLFSLNGQRIIQESEMNGAPENGDRLILLSLLAGG
jgi:molybdopterin converting factor small subunit